MKTRTDYSSKSINVPFTLNYFEFCEASAYTETAPYSNRLTHG